MNTPLDILSIDFQPSLPEEERIIEELQKKPERVLQLLNAVFYYQVLLFFIYFSFFD